LIPPKRVPLDSSYKGTLIYSQGISDKINVFRHWRNEVQMLSSKKAVSTTVVIILLLCAAVFGAFLSYMWALSNYYLEPANISLAITNLDFSPYHSDYFYVTVMNPSSSPSATNITAIYFTVKGNTQVYNVTDTSPESLPIPLERATNKTIKCLSNWGNFAGSTITVHVSALNASGAVASIATSFVKLGLQVHFNATASCRQFNVTITNSAQSAINLTLTNLYINQWSIGSAKRLPVGQNVSIPGINLPIGQNVSLQCLWDWETLTHPEILVQTLQGYQANATANATAAVLLLITNVAFNETNPNANEMSITVSNSNASSNAVDISDIFLTYKNGTASQVYHINGSNTSPRFAPYYALGIDKTVTFDHCIWNWGDFRNQAVTISVNVTQGFTPASTTVKIPSSLVFNITDLSFNLNDTSHFVATIANMPVSLGNASILMIRVNGTDVENFTSQVINIGEEGIFNCTFDWRSFRGKNANVTAELSNDEIISRNITLPIVDLKLLVGQLKPIEGIPYVNITVGNSIFSNKTVNVTQIIFKIGNVTDTIDGKLTYPALFPTGYVLNIGANVTILCPWNWALYPSQNLTITVQTAEGFSVSQTLQIPESTP
jgi:hypothetical protein